MINAAMNLKSLESLYALEPNLVLEEDFDSHANKKNVQNLNRGRSVHAREPISRGTLVSQEEIVITASLGSALEAQSDDLHDELSRYTPKQEYARLEQMCGYKIDKNSSSTHNDINLPEIFRRNGFAVNYNISELTEFEKFPDLFQLYICGNLEVCSALFPKLALFNHSCCPNLEYVAPTVEKPYGLLNFEKPQKKISRFFEEKWLLYLQK